VRGFIGGTGILACAFCFVWKVALHFPKKNRAALKDGPYINFAVRFFGLVLGLVHRIVGWAALRHRQECLCYLGAGRPDKKGDRLGRRPLQNLALLVV
jgi:hypothetical protein